jgi:hypothetical protein
VKQLFSPDGLHYGCDAGMFDAECMGAIRPIFERWARDGFNPRELAYLLHRTITDVELGYIIERQCEEYKKEKAEKEEKRRKSLADKTQVSD